MRSWCLALVATRWGRERGEGGPEGREWGWRKERDQTWGEEAKSFGRCLRLVLWKGYNVRAADLGPPTRSKISTSPTESLADSLNPRSAQIWLALSGMFSIDHVRYLWRLSPGKREPSNAFTARPALPSIPWTPSASAPQRLPKGRRTRRRAGFQCTSPFQVLLLHHFPAVWFWADRFLNLSFYISKGPMRRPTLQIVVVF